MMRLEGLVDRLADLGGVMGWEHEVVVVSDKGATFEVVEVEWNEDTGVPMLLIRSM